MDAAGNVYVNDQSRTVNVFAPDGSLIMNFGSGVLVSPRDIVIDSQGRVIVADSSTVKIFDGLVAGPPDPIMYPANGHYYGAVSVPDGINWADAKATAESMMFMGFPGHLATITSQDENDFIVTNYPDAAPNFWLGGFQPSGSPEPAEGWEWVTGEPFEYTNWTAGEPNNSGGNEDAIRFWDAQGQWNDETGTGIMNGFVVEFGTVALPTCNGMPATIVGDGSGAPIMGTPGDDVIVGTEGNDVIFGRGGNDYICSLGGGDHVFGGPGDDWIWGGDGNDVLQGGLGRDRLWGGPGSDEIRGGKGRDWLWGGLGHDVLNGGRMHDRLFGGRGNDSIFGGLGEDIIRCGPGVDVAHGGPGLDVADLACESVISVP